jgi:RNA 3'-terminal phosphate cyclase
MLAPLESVDPRISDEEYLATCREVRELSDDDYIALLRGMSDGSSPIDFAPETVLAARYERDVVQADAISLVFDRRRSSEP